MQTIPQASLAEGQTVLTLQPGRLNIGRASENDVAINDPAVSRYHARIITYFHESFLIDLDSEAGTFLNGVRIFKHSLKNGDVIQLGKHHLFIKKPKE